MLDYETSVRKCLSSFFVCTQNRVERKIIVDSALIAGINEYEFVVYNITSDGVIIWDSATYTTPGKDIVEPANSFLMRKSEILSNFVLPTATPKGTVLGLGLPLFLS